MGPWWLASDVDGIPGDLPDHVLEIARSPWTQRLEHIEGIAVFWFARPGHRMGFAIVGDELEVACEEGAEAVMQLLERRFMQAGRMEMVTERLQRIRDARNKRGRERGRV